MHLSFISIPLVLSSRQQQASALQISNLSLCAHKCVIETTTFHGSNSEFCALTEPACTCYRRNRLVVGLGACGDVEADGAVMDAGCGAQDFEDAEVYLGGLCGSGSVRGGGDGVRNGVSSESLPVSATTSSAGETSMLETTGGESMKMSMSQGDEGWVVVETMITNVPTPATSNNAAVSSRIVSEAPGTTTTEIYSESRAQDSALASTSNMDVTPTLSARPKQTQTQTSARRLSSSAKVALAAGVPCGVIFFVGIAAGVRMLSLRRKVKEANEVTCNQIRPNKDGEKSLERELDGFDTSRHEMETDSNRVELHVAVETHEMETHANRVELHGAVARYELDGR
ncbi:hypothetical protein BKA58DRAFT_448178 [Alternaria rosae]|uniref:uncharacterized protein n=1 Tax=Alternaria rosae TaxID=1187941 RepID=UPI001E8D88E2|nr:uncharacterized protein BKA58DRAFT_448178 [Alternaria rosae]KAH6883391.1 hypothetical protein BKA58DRAFT_448178 [Alternaria rosae]